MYFMSNRPLLSHHFREIWNTRDGPSQAAYPLNFRESKIKFFGKVEKKRKKYIFISFFLLSLKVRRVDNLTWAQDIQC